MNHFNARLDVDSASLNRNREGANILEHFRRTCKFFHIGDDIIQRLDALHGEYEKTGRFSEETWLKFLKIFHEVIEVRTKSNVSFLGWQKKMESMDSINASLYKFGINIIKGYLGYLKSEIHTLKSMPMKWDTAELVSDMEEEVVVLTDILSESEVKTDWRGFRNYLDDIQSRIAQTKRVLEKSQRKRAPEVQKEVSPVKQKIQPTLAETVESTREHAWGSLLQSGNTANHQHISNQELERIKANLHPEYSYDKVTNTIIKTVKSSRPATPGMGALDMENLEYKKAMAKVLKQQGSLATPLSIEVRDDLHKKYGMKAANGELMYNTLAETFSGTSTWNPIDLSVAGFDEFQILTHEKNAPNSPWHTLRVSARRHGSSVREILTIMCKPEEVRAGAQARFAIKTRLPAQAGEKEAKYTTTIEFLEVSRIRNMKKTYGNTASTPTQPKSFWDKTKDSVKSTWKDWFSKKAA